MTYFRSLSLAIACCLSLFASGCATSVVDERGPGVSLPPRPAFMRPVGWPDVGTSAAATIARHREALKAANGRLQKSGAWYDEVRKGYAK